MHQTTTTMAMKSKSFLLQILLSVPSPANPPSLLGFWKRHGLPQLLFCSMLRSFTSHGKFGLSFWDLIRFFLWVFVFFSDAGEVVWWAFQDAEREAIHLHVCCCVPIINPIVIAVVVFVFVFFVVVVFCFVPRFSWILNLDTENSALETQ